MKEIYRLGAWFLYDDLYEHKLTGKHKLSDSDKIEIARWILFLKTDLEYKWAKRLVDNWLLNFILEVITLTLSTRILLHRKRRKQGDLDVWPFLNREDYEKALSFSL